ncbi:SbcC/MukB-like Walker B domain-containing protein, partial [Nocardioides massiliensis]
RRSELIAQVEQHRAVAARAAAEAAEARSRLGSLLQGDTGRDPDGSLLDLAGALRAEQQRVGGVLGRTRTRIDALRSAQAAVTAHERTAALLADPLAEAGFADADAARAALLTDDQARDLRARVQAVEDMAAEAAAVLREPPPDELTSPDPGDAATAALRLAEARSTVLAAEEAAQQAERVHATAADRWQAAQQLAARLDDAITDWLPAAAEHQHADGLTRLVRGTSADNRLQMRLSAYVLATRLDQVVDAANVRLARMRDRRFLLRRTDRAASRRTRAGLDLEVLDQWTGVARAPSSLSGGETFVVSLTLALGLADVIAQETGGVELETLFIDEGFGMLDADTLDDVLDRLDELRAGGRSVGVVSHVSEMRARIPVQVRVEKTRSGSRVMSPHDLDRSRTPS